jgi:hypothetical protein
MRSTAFKGSQQVFGMTMYQRWEESAPILTSYRADLKLLSYPLQFAAYNAGLIEA